jgi:putative transposase
MSAHQAVFPIKTMARVFKVSASGYYAWRGRPASARAAADIDLTRKIRTIHASSRKIYGAPRIHVELKADGVAIGKKRVARLMGAAGLVGASRCRSATTTRREPDHRTADGSTTRARRGPFFGGGGAILRKCAAG